MLPFTTISSESIADKPSSELWLHGSEETPSASSSVLPPKSDWSMAYQMPPNKLNAIPVKTSGASKTGSEKNTMPSKTTTKLDKFPKTNVDVALTWKTHPLWQTKMTCYMTWESLKHKSWGGLTKYLFVVFNQTVVRTTKSRFGK